MVSPVRLGNAITNLQPVSHSVSMSNGLLPREALFTPLFPSRPLTQSMACVVFIQTSNATASSSLCTDNSRTTDKIEITRMVPSIFQPPSTGGVLLPPPGRPWSPNMSGVSGRSSAAESVETHGARVELSVRSGSSSRQYMAVLEIEAKSGSQTPRRHGPSTSPTSPITVCGTRKSMICTTRLTSMCSTVCQRTRSCGPDTAKSPSGRVLSSSPSYSEKSLVFHH